MLDITDAAKMIRKDLKACGVRRGAVSVTCGHDAIRVKVIAPDVVVEAVEAIAKRYEVVQRDALGESTPGGNLFVFVS